MKLSELKVELKHIDFDTIRMDRDNYFETVILNNELTKLTQRLEKFFGSSMTSSGGILSFQVQGAIKDFGGIKPGQTLYCWREDNDVLFAMLWPWQDGRHTTVKIIQKELRWK